MNAVDLPTARAIAHSNIALVKYWGKREGDTDQNLPATGSLSMTLGRLRTETRVAPAQRDRFQLDGTEHVQDEVALRAFRHLDRVWEAAPHRGKRPPCFVESTNHDLPTAAGLASSASGFAALTLAAAGCFGVSDDRTRLTQLARRGSGSAARSLFGGFVRLDRGTRPDGADCIARKIFPIDHWDVRLLVVHTARGPKAVGSTGGMDRSRRTSPYYPAWVDSSDADLDAAEDALRRRDLDALGAVVEHSCFKMHACMFATRPPLVYWRGSTLEAIHEVWRARDEGLRGFVTSDAGPHVKVLCTAADAPLLADRLSAVPGVLEVESVSPGPDASMEIE